MAWLFDSLGFLHINKAHAWFYEKRMLEARVSDNILFRGSIKRYEAGCSVFLKSPHRCVEGILNHMFEAHSVSATTYFKGDQ